MNLTFLETCPASHSTKHKGRQQLHGTWQTYWPHRCAIDQRCLQLDKGNIRIITCNIKGWVHCNALDSSRLHQEKAKESVISLFPLSSSHLGRKKEEGKYQFSYKLHSQPASLCKIISNFLYRALPNQQMLLQQELFLSFFQAVANTELR